MSDDLAIVIAAAGSSSRLGAPKQLVVLEGRTLLARAIESALAIEGASTYVVVADLDGEIAHVAARYRVEIVHNAEHAHGMGTSFRAGLAAARKDRPSLGAVLFTLCDQPRLSSAHLVSLLGALDDRPIAASRYGDVLGAPAAFARSVFDELATIEGDRGAREVIRRDPTRVAAVPWEDGAIDVDRPEDVERIGGAM